MLTQKRTSGIGRVVAVLAAAAIASMCLTIWWSASGPADEQAIGAGSWPCTPESCEEVHASSVVDGDTISVGSERVRFIGMDTPEVGRCGADRATARVRELVEGQPIVLVAAPGREDRDHYGRLLRYVVVDGRDVGLLLISEGLARARYDGLDGFESHPFRDEYRRVSAATSHICDDAGSSNAAGSGPPPEPDPSRARLGDLRWPAVALVLVVISVAVAGAVARARRRRQNGQGLGSSGERTPVPPALGVGAHLVGAAFDGQCLSGADFSGADLSDASFVGADLRGARFVAARLVGADLSLADLSNADLDVADLSGANLSGADLRGASLRGTELSGADLTDAILPTDERA